MDEEKVYIAIDLKSFYASVECRERGLDPLTTNLVVADSSRTDKTICLAVSPSLKSFSIPGRARLYEVIQKVKQVNEERLKNAYGREFTGESFNIEELKKDNNLSLSYIIAPPRMAYYMDYSSRIYDIYLKYISPEDIHVYSIDEVFIDATPYLKPMNMTAHQLAMTMIRDVLEDTGITATAGIGPNMFLCKVAMDIVAKHIPADKDGVRIAEVDEISYREQLWDHKPLTDFWRVGRGYERRLNEYGIYTMGDIARCSLGGPNDFYNEELLYKLFGVNAELLIDHAWGYEPCTIADIKKYKPQNNSISNGQVLMSPYSYEKAKIIVKEMTESLVLQLVDKKLVTDSIGLAIGYDRESLDDDYDGEISTDYYGRSTPKGVHSGARLLQFSSSTEEIMSQMVKVYEAIVNPNLLIRRITVVANNVINEADAYEKHYFQQLDLFSENQPEIVTKSDSKKLEKEKRIQQAVLDIKKKYGKNAVVKAMSLQEGATAMDRNNQIGGHKA